MTEAVTKTEIKNDYSYLRGGIKKAKTIKRLQGLKHTVDTIYMKNHGYKPVEEVLRAEYIKTTNVINKRADSLGLAYKVKTKIWGKPIR